MAVSLLRSSIRGNIVARSSIRGNIVARSSIRGKSVARSSIRGKIEARCSTRGEIVGGTRLKKDELSLRKSRVLNSGPPLERPHKTSGGKEAWFRKCLPFQRSRYPAPIPGRQAVDRSECLSAGFPSPTMASSAG
jgi:hypothetical protein